MNQSTISVMVFVALWISVGCESPTANDTASTSTDALDGSKVGGHPNTVIFELEGLDLRQTTGNISDGRVDNVDYTTVRALQCTGMLVAPNLILTAAHCMGAFVWTFPLDEHRLRFFNHTTANTDFEFKWKDLAVYRNNALDLAFVQLPHDVPMPKQVTLNLSNSSEIPQTGILAQVDGHTAYDQDVVYAKDIRTGNLLISEVRTTSFVGAGSLSPATPTYYAEWSLEYPLLAQPGDSGGPVYVQSDSGDADVYGVMSRSSQVPEGKTTSEYCTGTARETDPCSMAISNLAIGADWVTDVLRCATSGSCSPEVLKSKSIGYGMTKQTFVFEQRCPEATTQLETYSMRFSSDMPGIYDVTALYDGGPFTHWLLPDAFESHGNEEMLSARVEQFFSDLDVGVMVFPSALQGSDPEVKYQRCSIDYGERLRFPFQKPLGQVCPSGTQEIVDLYLNNNANQEAIAEIRLVADEGRLTKTIRQPVDAQSGAVLAVGFRNYDLSDLSVDVISGQRDALQLGYNYSCEFE